LTATHPFPVLNGEVVTTGYLLFMTAKARENLFNRENGSAFRRRMRGWLFSIALF
jgi:hypothetical protein